MEMARRVALWFLITGIFATTLCAQACLEPTPTQSECPAHHTKDCCKHEGSNSDRAGFNALTVHVINKPPVVSPAQTTRFFHAEVHDSRDCSQGAFALKSSSSTGTVPIPFALRI